MKKKRSYNKQIFFIQRRELQLLKSNNNYILLVLSFSTMNLIEYGTHTPIRAFRNLNTMS